MSVAQEAFRATIEAGYYPYSAGTGSRYMCVALDMAQAAGVISERQRDAGWIAIDRVLAGRPDCMASAVLGHRAALDEAREWSVEHGVALYTNWDERVQTLEFPKWIEDDDDYDR